MPFIRCIYKQFLLFVVLLIFAGGCTKEENTPPIPLVVSPDMHKIYYPNEKIVIEWQVPDSTKTVEMQSLSVTDSSELQNAGLQFALARPEYTEKFTNTSRYVYSYAESISKTVFHAFRLRYTDGDNFSNWSPIYYYKVIANSALIRKPYRLVAKFDFVTQQHSGQYSNVLLSTNEIDLAAELAALGYNVSRIHSVKPVWGRVHDSSEHSHHIEHFSFGFGESNQPIPFVYWGGASYLVTNPEVSFNSDSRFDLFKAIGNQKTRMKAVYQFEDSFHDTYPLIGKQHNLTVTLHFDCLIRPE